MSDLYQRSLKKLELDQVLKLLADCAGSADGKQACLALQPTADLEDVRTMLSYTTAASDLCTKKGNPSFTGVTDVTASLDRAERGGCLQPKELLNIAGVLRCTRNVHGYVAQDEPATVLDPLFAALTPRTTLYSVARAFIASTFSSFAPSRITSQPLAASRAALAASAHLQPRIMGLPSSLTLFTRAT